MSPSSLLNVPGESPARMLFGIARELSLHADLATALKPCLSLLHAALGPSGVQASFGAFSLSRGEPLVVLATEPAESTPGYARRGQELSMGKGPGGYALERGETAIRSADSHVEVEVPVREGESVRGVFGCRATPKQGGAQELKGYLEAAALLFGEAIALRRSLGYGGFGTLPAWCGEDPEQLSAIAGSARAAASADPSFEAMVGRSGAMQAVYALVASVARSDATVLISGESGTGKELVARAIHERSDHAGGPFIAVNCAALPESIIESELFGHERGSFTGAHAARAGRFELARDGTLFLDEIGELSPAIQVKLLRILQERSFERVGGTRSIETNARIIAATNRDLAAEVRARRFREDLYFRLNVFPIHVPPLRERGADILLLADHFTGEFARRSGKQLVRISSPALDLLMSYHWPGNVRELENCIERAAILSTDGVIHAYHLPPSLQSAESTGTAPLSTMDGAIARLEKEMLVEALKFDRGNAAAAARRLGITERRFRLGLERYKIDWHKFRTKM